MLTKFVSAIKSKGLISWMPVYWVELCFPKEKPNPGKPVHIILSVVDHFEPFHGSVGLDRAKKRVNEWVKEYPLFADKHKDADGRPPQHTWFYPPHLDHCFLKSLVDLCKKGYGEIEMHLHHNHMKPFPDTPETLRSKILKCIDDYAKFGIFCLPDGTKRFGFVHGDWSLDNSRGSEICGVNDEITILKECGCYADFTFPSLGDAQPAMINKVYYAKDDPNKAKSYNKGEELYVGGKKQGDILMIQGIIGLRWKSRTHRFKPTIESSDISKSNYPFKERIDYWVENAVTIRNQPNLKFIKLHTHGAVEDSFDVLFGKQAGLMYDYMEKKYNDGKKSILHYVTARGMYNIIKATEAGKLDDPNEFRNFEIPEYIYLKG